MSPSLAALVCFAAYVLAYRFYARYLARHVFCLDPSRLTPAHTLQDGMDYVPTNRWVLLGHHYASIAGLSPMLGPAIAVIWGWVPAMLWVVVGTVFVGAVHDFGALVVSMRARGLSIGKVAESVVGARARSLFHAIIFFLIAMAMGVFVNVVALLFTADYYPQASPPTFGLIILALVMGVLYYRKGWRLGPLAGASFVILLGMVWGTARWDGVDIGFNAWNGILLAYGLVASILPVWLLLQPRDFVNSLLLYLGLALMFIGLFVLNPEFVAPAVQAHPEGAPPLFPFVFIVIACGALSGFHGLVSSGTTAKQINVETDAPLLGYGGMIGESLLGLIAVLGTTAGLGSSEAWQRHYSSWGAAEGLGPKIDAFIQGTAAFVHELGIPLETAKVFVALIAVSFALTTLDSAMRLLRYNITEIADSARMPLLTNRYLASLGAVAAIAFFAFYRVDGRPVGTALWELFGTTNQILGGLTLLTITLYLRQRGRRTWFTFIPMVFMMITAISAMILKIGDFVRGGQYLLLAIGAVLLGLSIWLVVEAALRFRRGAA